MTKIKDMFKEIRNKQMRAAFYVVLLFFLVFIFIPAVVLLRNAFTLNSGAFTFRNVASVFAGGKLQTAFSHSVNVSLLSAFITTVLAFVLAYTVNFTNIPVWAKKTLRTLAVFPMLIPTITYGFAIIYSFGKNGLLTRLIGRQFFDFYGFKGLIFGYVIYTFPISFTLLTNTMAYIDRRYIVVCRLMGDSRLRSFFTAVIQPLLGTIAVSVVQSFFLAFTDFGIPASIGGRYTVVAGLLYNTMLGSLPDFHQGSVIALCMLLPSIVSILLLNYLQRFNVRYNKIAINDNQPDIVRDIIWSFLSVVICVLILSSFVVVFVAPFVAEWPYNNAFTVRHIVSVFNDAALLRVFKNSLVMSFLTALFGTLLVYASALVSARNKGLIHGTKIIEAIAQVSNTIPGMVLGISFLLAFRKTPLHNTLAILVCCNLVHFFATPYLMMKASLDKMNISWETTARILGDNWIKTVARIITPNVIRTQLEIFCYLFINGMVTVSAVVFLAGARTMVITTKIQELQHFAKFNEIFILSLLILVVNLAIKTVKGIVNKKQ